MGGSATLTFPRIQGADVAGRVAAVGEGVDPARLGERGLLDFNLYPDDRRDINLTPDYYGHGADGGFAEYVAVPSDQFHTVDKADLADAELAAMGMCSYQTALHMLTSANVVAGERVLVTGPSGSGKSTLFRAIAGIWPFGTGSIFIPEKAKLMMLPQRPYFPVGILHDAVVYPAEAGAFDPAQVRDALIAVGLPDLAERLEEDGHWNRMLSLGEQQRLGLARALLHVPDYLFLDEATASLDEPSEARLYRLLMEKLPQATIVSIGHRSTLDAFHTRKVALVKDGAIHVLGGGALAEKEPSAAS